MRVRGPGIQFQGLVSRPGGIP